MSKLGGKHVNIDLEPFPSTIVMDDIVLPGTPSPAYFCLCCNTQTGSLDNNFEIDCLPIHPYSTKPSQCGLNRDLNPGPPAPEAGIIPLDHRAMDKSTCEYHCCTLIFLRTPPAPSRFTPFTTGQRSLKFGKVQLC